ncbi:MAG: serpin family protein [Porphyromonas sp.]|nr:serpin family protein [Porphyromonas sp.]
MKKHLTYLMGVALILIIGCNKNAPNDPNNPDTPLPPDKVKVLSEVDLPELGASVPVIPNTQEEPISENDKDFVEGSNDFAYKMFAQQAEKYKGENLILSPLSWDYAIAMVAAGAAKDVWEELTETMGWNGVKDPDISAYHKRLTRHLETSSSFQRVFTSNAMWIDDNRIQQVNEEYPKILKEYFGAVMSILDLSQPEAISHINNWVERKTYSKIKNLLSPSIASGNLSFILTNALYFNSPWQSPFDQNNTVKENFTAADGTVQEVDMMRDQKVETFVDLPDVQILRLPTEGRGFFVDIILPKDKNQPLTPEFLTKYAPHEVFKKYSRQLPVNVYLPKFNFTTELLTLIDKNKPELAAAIGLSKLIRPNALVNIIDNPDLQISKIVQKCVVKWNEKGVEAAAATAVAVIDKAPPVSGFEFRVDHPFFFTITHAGSNKLMFVGQVNKI